MPGHVAPRLSFAGRGLGVASLVAVVLVLVVAPGATQNIAAPQDISPPGPSLSVTPNPDPQAQPAPQPAPPGDNPGLIQEIGRLFERGAASVRGQLDGAKKQIDTINQNATTTSKTIGDAAVDVGKTATGVVTAPLNVARIVSGHERCGVAPNGAPDCVTAAETLCKRHGYTVGKSLDFTSAEQCKPTVFLAGRDNAPACTTVTFISRAMCQ